MDDRDYEKILIEREYKKHKEHIKKCKEREYHLKYKDIGYTMAMDKLVNCKKLLNLFLGYLKSMNVSEQKMKEIMYHIVQLEDSKIEEYILNMINIRTKDL